MKPGSDRLRVIPLALAFLVPGCVTERNGPPPRGIPVSPSSAPQTPVSNPQRGSTPATASGPPITLPSGPIAYPARGESVSSQVTMAFADIGAIPYDGIVLPLISPNGAFVATQTGDPIPWPALLAQPDTRPPAGAKVIAFSLRETNSPAALGAELIQWPNETPLGLLLGRSCDNAGFLVEYPRPGGQRWIGRVPWLSGGVIWLAQGDLACAHACLGGSGELAFSRRTPGASPAELVVRVPGRAELVLSNPGVVYDYPSFSDEPGILYVFAVSASGVDLQAVSLPQPGGFSGMAVTASHHLLDKADLAAVYQAAAPIQTPIPRPLRMEGADSHAPRSTTEFTFLHPGWGCMAVFDRRTSSLYALSKDSVGAAPFVDPEQRGFLTTTKRGLAFERARQDGQHNSPNGIRSEPIQIVAEPLLARLTTDEKWPYMLIGPAQENGQARLELYRMRPGEALPGPGDRPRP